MIHILHTIFTFLTNKKGILKFISISIMICYIFFLIYKTDSLTKSLEEKKIIIETQETTLNSLSNIIKEKDAAIISLQNQITSINNIHTEYVERQNNIRNIISNSRNTSKKDKSINGEIINDDTSKEVIHFINDTISNISTGELHKK